MPRGFRTRHDLLLCACVRCLLVVVVEVVVVMEVVEVMVVMGAVSEREKEETRR